MNLKKQKDKETLGPRDLDPKAHPPEPQRMEKREREPQPLEPALLC